jgi:alkanesulfonate monooxygenase SsuD/methylene tetrahydromethanopterin reductase-like flavin-dependent oxidoreductase (luciferase family)
LIKQGLMSDELTFSGEFYKFSKVPMVLKPVQRPYPPLWYGVLTPDGAHWAALESAHIVTLVPPVPARAIIDKYRAEWKNFGRSDDKLPLMGILRHVVLAETDATAIRTAERAYRLWLNHMELLWTRHGAKLPLGLPAEIGPLLEARVAFAGTITAFKSFLDDQISSTGANYFVCDVAFGNITPEESMRTISLLGDNIIPLFSDNKEWART